MTALFTDYQAHLNRAAAQEFKPMQLWKFVQLSRKWSSK